MEVYEYCVLFTNFNYLVFKKHLNLRYSVLLIGRVVQFLRVEILESRKPRISDRCKRIITTVKNKLELP